MEILANNGKLCIGVKNIFVCAERLREVVMTDFRFLS